MTRRERELYQVLSAVAERANAKLGAMQTTGRNHLKAVFVKDDGASICMFLAATPSDNARTLRNDAAQAKRLLRDDAMNNFEATSHSTDYVNESGASAQLQVLCYEAVHGRSRKKAAHWIARWPNGRARRCLPMWRIQSDPQSK